MKQLYVPRSLGFTIKTKLSVRGQHGSISLVESPKHLYRNVIMEAALHGTIAELHRRRPHLAPVQNIDWHLTSMLWRKKNTEIGPGASQRHLLAMAAGGHWRQTHLKAIDPSESDNCILCGQGRDDEEHLWTSNNAGESRVTPAILRPPC